MSGNESFLRIKARADMTIDDLERLVVFAKRLAQVSEDNGGTASQSLGYVAEDAQEIRAKLVKLRDELGWESGRETTYVVRQRYLIIPPKTVTNPTADFRVAEYQSWEKYARGGVSAYKIADHCATYGEAETLLKRLNAEPESFVL